MPRVLTSSFSQSLKHLFESVKVPFLKRSELTAKEEETSRHEEEEEEEEEEEAQKTIPIAKGLL